jgi:microcystin-dependent protein
MATPFLGEIRLLPFTFAPKGWALCNGQLLAINQNQALFALLGTSYGGDGRTTFALPDLRGRIPMDTSDSHPLGEAVGEIQHTLTAAELPAHAHVATARNQEGNDPSPAGRAWGIESAAQSYGAPSSPPVAMSPNTVASVGGGQPHENRPPYLVLNFCIALQGIFPSRN